MYFVQERQGEVYSTWKHESQNTIANFIASKGLNPYTSTKRGEKYSTNERTVRSRGKARASHYDKQEGLSIKRMLRDLISSRRAP